MASLHPRFGRRAPRSARVPSSATLLDRQRMRSSPLSHDISSWLVFSRCLSSPVFGSRLRETEVLVLECIGAIERRVCVFMDCSLPTRPQKTYSNKSEQLL